MADAEAQVQPCPGSGYRIAADHAWRLLLTFAIYQVTLSTLLLVLFVSRLGPTHLGKTDADLFLTATSIYCLAAWASLPLLFWRRPGYLWQSSAHLLLDIAALIPVLYACGGLGSGFGVLLAVSVAAAALLIGGRCALGYAAMAGLAVLGVELYGDWHNAFNVSHYTYAGMLGLAYFTITLLATYLAGRAEQSEALASRRQVDLVNLQKLNEFIVQHLQSGIVVLDSERRVRLFNEAAMRLLGLSRPPRDSGDLPGLLTAALREWQAQDSAFYTATLMTDTEPLHIRASRLPMQGETLTMVFIEDKALHQQRVQESKLASLGRLTAGIAHEIRNPLGAISHAAQLLEESGNLDPQDLRLVGIVRKHVRRVDETIGNVLQLSRRCPARRERLQLNHWLEKFRHEFHEEIRRDALRLQLPPRTLNALADPGQLKQILANLCHNALKYGPGSDGRITVRLCQEGRRPCIEVIDEGPGIPDEQLARVFEPFFTTSASGTGLGLYIARELAQLNQALLEYDNGLRGSRFRIILTNADQVTLEL
ncbi:MAG TPA: PAS domain-containing protein [Methylothermaceae bacterium]|nr:PAS domain-containing protein [Methylothermaceae bacterium]